VPWRTPQSPAHISKADGRKRKSPSTAFSPRKFIAFTPGGDGRKRRKVFVLTGRRTAFEERGLSLRGMALCILSELDRLFNTVEERGPVPGNAVERTCLDKSFEGFFIHQAEIDAAAKSNRFSNRPLFSRMRMISWTALTPTFFMALSPKRIPEESPRTERCFR